MSEAQASGGSRRQARSSAAMSALVIGVPLGVGILYMMQHGPLAGPTAQRYVSHPVEYAEVIMFCCALAALLVKAWNLIGEKAAFRKDLLKPWDGKTVPVAEAKKLLAELDQKPRRWQTTYLGRRIASVLEFLVKRGSAVELDDQLRGLGDTDSISLEGSYSLIRFITWAIPILGFLGTVLGITGAISGVTPDRLEHNLGDVTDGLALAFDCTALALSLTMIVMFVSSMVERMEHGLLGAVDHFAENELAHRFERLGHSGGEAVDVVRSQTNAVIVATQTLVERQAEIWSKAFDAANNRRAQIEAEVREDLRAALGSALEKSLEAHASRLFAMEKQSAAGSAALVEKLTGISRLVEGMAAQTQALAKLQEGEHHLLRLQQSLQNNLAALNDGGAFEQAVHSLTAAIHLLTAQSSMHSRRPGAAA